MQWGSEQQEAEAAGTTSSGVAPVIVVVDSAASAVALHFVLAGDVVLLLSSATGERGDLVAPLSAFAALGVSFGVFTLRADSDRDGAFPERFGGGARTPESRCTCTP